MGPRTFFIPVMLMAATVFSSCENGTINTGNGSEKVTGSGTLKKEERAISEFSKIHITGVFNVFLAQGAKESVSVEGDDNVLPMITTEVVEDTLRIRLKEDISLNTTRTINVYVTLVNVDDIDMEGVGALKSTTPLNVKKLALNNTGIGTTYLELNGDELDVNTASVGALTLKGVVTNAMIKQEGVGILDAFELKTRTLSLVSSGVGACEVYASDKIDINASGIGSVRYKGGAAGRTVRSEGVGKVSEVN